MNNVLEINSYAETRRITSFVKTVLNREGFENVIIGMSGGLDSTTAFYLLKEAIPPENIFVAHLYYFDSNFKEIEPILQEVSIPKDNIYEISIEPLVKAFQFHLGGVMASTSFQPATSEVQKRTHLRGGRLARRSLGEAGMDSSEVDDVVKRIRLGNIMARARMIILYDLAKKHNALVCGTENKSEYLLGYFTRFGDQASDFEPIQHLYKTQVYQLANFLGVPKNIMEKIPTAGLWHGQTDEEELGFTYKEADQVLYYYYDSKLKLEEIKKMGFINAEKIITFCARNAYKHNTPYILGFTNNNPNTKHH